MKKPTQHLIAEVPRKRGQVELTIGIDLGDVWSHYCTLNQQGEVIDRGRFQDHTEGDRQVVYRRASRPSGDGGRRSFDLDQRTA